MLRTALRERRLVRLRCMRRTLHLVPADLAPIVHAATLAQRLGPCRLERERSDVTARQWDALASAVRDCLAQGEQPYRQLEAGVEARLSGALARHRDRIKLVRLAIKTLWESGELLVGDSSPSLHHERRTFVLTEDATPRLGLNQCSPAHAIERLLPLYLAAFGPVSVRDFGWWSGLGLGDALRAWEAVADRLVRIRLIGRDEELVALDETVRQMRQSDGERSGARVLAYEDPSLKGYFASRWRYAASAHLPRLFNSIGEARASVLLDGRVSAVWHWDRRGRRARYEPLTRLSSSQRREVDEVLSAVTGYLRAEPLLSPRHAYARRT